MPLERRLGAAEHEAAAPSSVLTVGTVVWLAAELMFLSGLFAAHFTLCPCRAATGRRDGVELEPLVAGMFTVALVASSGTIELGAPRPGDRRTVSATESRTVVGESLLPVPEIEELSPTAAQ